MDEWLIWKKMELAGQGKGRGFELFPSKNNSNN